MILSPVNALASNDTHSTLPCQKDKKKKKHKPFEVNSFLVTLMNVVLGFFRKSWSLISFVLVM